ncbi:MAG: SlyX family protein [Desulfovibrio sp.]|nr:SlyX family protein [Desulfovibrio sp.]
MELEERINKLEENQYFQEKLLQDLDAVLLAQNSKIAMLQEELHSLQREVVKLRELYCVPKDVRPPHSAPETFYT